VVRHVSNHGDKADNIGKLLKTFAILLCVLFICLYSVYASMCASHDELPRVGKGSTTWMTSLFVKGILQLVTSSLKVWDHHWSCISTT